jgi:hypothetical protein
MTSGEQCVFRVLFEHSKVGDQSLRLITNVWKQQ